MCLLTEKKFPYSFYAFTMSCRVVKYLLKLEQLRKQSTAQQSHHPFQLVNSYRMNCYIFLSCRFVTMQNFYLATTNMWRSRKSSFWCCFDTWKEVELFCYIFNVLFLLIGIKFVTIPLKGAKMLMGIRGLTWITWCGILLSLNYQNSLLNVLG